MAQTTGAVSARDLMVEVSLNGSTWTNISGQASAVDPGESTRMSGEAYTFDGDGAIIRSGKREPTEVAVKIVYTEGNTDAFEVVETAFAAGNDIYVRWSPAGGQTGDRRFTTDAGPIVSFMYPKGEAEDPAPILCGFTVKTAKITPSDISA